MEEIIRLAFTQYHQPTKLAQLPLAKHAVVRTSFLDGDTPAIVSGWAVRALLDWALVQMQKNGKAWAQQSVDVLQQRYINGLSATQYADLMLISDSTAQTRRRSAVRRITTLIEEELNDPTHQEERRTHFIAVRYDAQSENGQTQLRVLSLLDTPVDPILLSGRFIDTERYALIDANLVINNGRTISIHPQIKSWVQQQLSGRERIIWHKEAASYYAERHDWLSAIIHFLACGQDETAANLIVEHHKSLPTTDLQPHLDHFQPNDLPSKLWAELRLVAGWLAFVTGDIEIAIRAYEQALRAPLPIQKARAYFNLADVFAQTNTERALAHYDACHRLLTSAQTEESNHLLAQALIKHAKLLAEQFNASEKAQKLLDEAKTHIDHYQSNEWLTIRSDWHAIMGLIQYRVQKLESAAEHRWQAWQYAQEADDDVRSAMTTHNLGAVYNVQNRPIKAREMFEESLRLTLNAGNERLTAANEKGLGVCAYQLREYDRALTHYRTAYHQFAESGDEYWQAAACYDIVETALKTNESSVATQFWQEGFTLARETGSESLVAGFEALAETYPELQSNLNARQRDVIELVRQQKEITNRAYCEQFDVSRKTAENDLRTLVEQNIFAKIGKGRGVKYILVDDSV